MESKLARIVKTFTFRLALVYVGLFSLSVILLFAFIYTFATNYLASQTQDAVKMQYYHLLNEYHEKGSSGLEERIRELIAKDTENSQIYLVVNKDYEKLGGNLNEWPLSAERGAPFEKDGYWVRFHIEGGQNLENGVEVRAIVVPISKWRWLLVGQSMQGNEKVEQIIVQTFWASLTLTLIMAFIGAIIMTRSVMQRLSVINRSAHTIIHGDLSARVPYTSGGDEFDELSGNLNQMLDRIERLLQSLSQIASNIAHDLRSPLNRIINRLDAGLRTIDETNPARTLLEKNIHDMQGLVGTFTSILNISELEAGTGYRQFEHCDLANILTDLIDLYEPVASERHIALINRFDEGLIIQGEKNLLTQAFANLLDNALKFTPPNGRITLTGEYLGNRIDIVIADSGPGIPAAYHGKVFEKFFRMEQSRATPGNGLGLSLVGAIANIHAAVITLEDNEPGLLVRLSFNV